MKLFKIRAECRVDESVILYPCRERERERERDTERQTERKGEGHRRRKMRTRKRKSIQGFIVAEHIVPGKMSTVQPKETLPRVETKTLTQTENEYKMKPFIL